MPAPVFRENLWTLPDPSGRNASPFPGDVGREQNQQLFLLGRLGENDPMVYDPDGLRALTFSVASRKWIETRRRFLRKTTYYGYEVNLNHLDPIFGGITVGDIRLHHFTMYQALRTVNSCEHGVPNGKGCSFACRRGLWANEAGPSVINHELNLVQQTLRRAGLWHRFREYYQPLPVPQWRPPKTMTDQEEVHLYKTAASNPRWRMVYMVILISCNTSATGTEVRHIRLRDLDLDSARPAVSIIGDHLKNNDRVRRIELNRTAVEAFRVCIERAKELGAVDSEHFIFPFRVHRSKWDITRPASSSFIRKSFEELRVAAGLPWLTPHCFRHQCATVLYENEADDETVRHTLGHQSVKMSHWYSHNRRARQRAVLEKIDPSMRFGPQSVRIPRIFGASA